MIQWEQQEQKKNWQMGKLKMGGCKNSKQQQPTTTNNNNNMD